MSESVEVRVARIETKIDAIQHTLNVAATPEGFTRCALHGIRMEELTESQDYLKKMNKRILIAMAAVLVFIGPEKVSAMVTFFSQYF
jgi:hypothetical protein